MKKPFNPEKTDHDNPEWTDEMFAKAKRGSRAARLGRPKIARPKVPMTIRIDADILEAFKATGSGWQTRINVVLKEWLASQNG
ncbi:MAG: BrnA antitoxin family protein [Pelistega sp.]|nr:BrnA antitoxin family protein [Pelistega sp.]